MAPITRSQTKSEMARNVLEQPPVLDRILHHVSNKMNSNEERRRDLVNMRMAFNPSERAKDVFNKHVDNARLYAEREYTFVRRIRENLNKCDESDDRETRLSIALALYDDLVAYKDILDSAKYTLLKQTAIIKLEDLRRTCIEFEEVYYAKYLELLK